MIWGFRLLITSIRKRFQAYLYKIVLREDRHSMLQWFRELAGSQGKTPRANNFTKSSRIFRGMSQVLRRMSRDVEGKIRKLTKCHIACEIFMEIFTGCREMLRKKAESMQIVAEFVGSSLEQDARYCNVKNCDFRVF